MLRRIRIQRLGVIDDAELELAPGLNVITGETGAGKTMVVSGLGLLLGDRADTALVRTGASTAVVEGEVELAAAHPAMVRADQAGADTSDGLILVRTLSAEGRSRAHVGGRAAPVGVLTEIGEHLVAVHGQADQWRLRRPEQHRLLLDTFGGPRVAAALTAYQETYDEWLATRQRLAELRESGSERTRQAQMLRAALEEIAAVAPQPGEEDDLAVEEDRLAHADGLLRAAEQAHGLLAGDDAPEPAPAPVLDQLGAATQALTEAGRHDPVLAELAGRLHELTYLASDISGELASYVSGIEADPARLAWVQDRRAALGALLRSYGASTTEVLAWAGEQALTLDDLDNSEERLAELDARVAQLHALTLERGAELTRLRSAAAADLGGRVSTELTHLAMGSATVRVQVMAATGEPRRHGLDEVEIQLAANPGAPARSVSRAASGGELSRVMLALEVVCADGAVPTYIFDEVDAGVGGAAALDLGARLARLARTAQVLVVTHLGQVAAFADRHLVVHKSSDGAVTASDVREVTGQERVREIARMLGGVSDSDAALEHAAELLAEHVPSRMTR